MAGITGHRHLLRAISSSYFQCQTNPLLAHLTLNLKALRHYQASPATQTQDAGPGGAPGLGGIAASGKDDGPESESKEALEERKRRTLQSYLEQQLGNTDPDRVTLALLLQQHGVVVRGGQAEALKLLEALKAWKADKWTAQPP